MNSDTAMEIIRKYTNKRNLNDEEIMLMSEALEYMRDNEYFCVEVWLFNLGHFYDRIGRYEKALKYYEMAIREGDTVSYIGIADTYRHMHEYDKSYEYYLKAQDAGFDYAAEIIEEMKEWIS